MLSRGQRELRARPPGSWIMKAAGWLDRAAFKPATLPDDIVTGIALLPPIAAGLIIFKLPALQMLAIAAAAGTLGLIASRVLMRGQSRHPGASVLIAPLFGVALVGPGASLVVSIEVAVVAVVIDFLRAQYMPAIRAQAGLLAIAAVALLTRNAPFTYFDPNGGTNNLDPIDTWYFLFHQSLWAGDPVRQYVGNVPGPVFATSLLAVAIGVGWLAYARRVSLAALFGFLAGGLLAVNTFHGDFVFQFDSGPTWFVAGFLLADRRLLPEAPALRPILGFAAGLFAIGLRRNGYGIEATYITVAAVQAMMAVIVIIYWSTSVTMERWKRDRRLRQREANLRVVKTITRAF